MLLLGPMRKEPMSLNPRQEGRCLSQLRHQPLLARSLSKTPHWIRVLHPVHPLEWLQLQSQGLRNQAKQESSDSCYEPVRLVQAQPLTEEHRALPPPDFSVSMRFSIQLKDSRKEPCSARYLHAVSIEYNTCHW